MQQIAVSKLSGKYVLDIVIEILRHLDSPEAVFEMLKKSRFLFVQDIQDFQDIPQNEIFYPKGDIAIFIVKDCNCPSCRQLENLVLKGIASKKTREQIDAEIALFQSEEKTMH